MVIIFILKNRIMFQLGKCAELYEKYRIESEIGRGASGICYRVQHTKTKETFAMKKIHISSMRKHNTRQACSQVTILSKLNHPHIIKLYQSFSDQSHLYIIMQYAPKGDLHHILKRRKIRRDLYSEAEIWQMARQILTALEYLHSRNIIHRDVKTLNIFMDSQGKLYLGDLGVSKILKTDNGLYSRVGTPLYLAPQIIKYEKYDYKADIWGLGCVCYQLASLNHPFQAKNIITLGQSIVNVHPKPLEDYSPQLNCFVLDMLQKNPSKRLSATDLINKYLKEGIPSQIKQLESPKKQEKREAVIQKISEKSANLLKSNQIRRKAINNFLEEKIALNQSMDLKAQDSSEAKKAKKNVNTKTNEKNQSHESQKSFDETLIFTRKMKSGQSNKYVESTHKTYLAANSCVNKSKEVYQNNNKNEREINWKKIENYQPLKSTQEASMQKVQARKNAMVSFSSQKKVPVLPPNPYGLKRQSKQVSPSSMELFLRRQEHKKTDVSLMREQTKKTQMSIADINRLSSQNQLQGISRVTRIRPKSSIMTKERHQSTMKNIKKSVRRMEMDEDIDRFVETRVLKKPQMIIL